MDAETQMRYYRENVGRARYVAALANEGRSEDGVCGKCGEMLPSSHKKTCGWHPVNIQHYGRPKVATAASNP